MPMNPTGIPYPELVDENNPPADFLAMATALSRVTSPQFGTTGQRDFAIPAPVVGQECTVSGVKYRWISGAWQIVDRAAPEHLGSPLVGGAPTPSLIRTRTGRTFVTTNANGGFSIPSGFTTTLLSASVQNIDHNQGFGLVIMNLGASTVPNPAFRAYSRTSGLEVGVQTLQIGYMLVGH